MNQVERYYDGFGMLAGEYQSHGGAVDTDVTPHVDYAYDDAGSGAVQLGRWPSAHRMKLQTSPDFH